ncbi:hypothetical protein HNY73_010947 [Argiope bruennichi]|uniref:Uncharacterized protein n=1 Tax=Argiope bruennichi TaxID=94029 RepID=A0A8T0F2M1_ARGBR|nr:hypothetical protein HNY73_010947 [Argiope bruennichi]
MITSVLSVTKTVCLSDLYYLSKVGYTNFTYLTLKKDEGSVTYGTKHRDNVAQLELGTSVWKDLSSLMHWGFDKPLS